jgi:peptide/nickel transport system substrate-binding protein
LHNLYFRKAIAYAIDRDKLVGTVLNGMGYAAHGGIVPPGMPLSDTGFVKGIRYNIDSAKYYLKLAGFPNGRGLPELSLLTSPSYQPVMEMIQYQLSEVGIRLTLDNGDGSSLREMIYQGKVAFWRASWIADYPDAENYLSLFYGENRAPSGPNTTRYQKDFYDAQFRASLLETKDSVRMKYHERLQQELIEDVPVILLYYDRIIRLIRNEVSGLEMDAMNNLNLKRVRKR